MKKVITPLKEELKKTEKLISDLEKSKSTILKKIEVEETKNKPKSIMDTVRSFSDVLKVAKPTKEELIILNYSGKSKRLIFMKDMMRFALVSEVLNEGWIPKKGEQRWYAWFDISSGFAFGNAVYVVSGADTASASRLCLKNRDLVIHVSKYFLNECKNVIL